MASDTSKAVKFAPQRAASARRNQPAVWRWAPQVHRSVAKKNWTPNVRSSPSRDSKRRGIDAPDQPHRRVRHQARSDVWGNVDG